MPTKRCIFKRLLTRVPVTKTNCDAIVETRRTTHVLITRNPSVMLSRSPAHPTIARITLLLLSAQRTRRTYPQTHSCTRSSWLESYAVKTYAERTCSTRVALLINRNCSTTVDHDLFRTRKRRR